MGRNLTRWLIPLPAVLFSFFPSTARAEPSAGLNAVGYNFYGLTNGGYPTQSDTLYPVCHTETENNINRNFNGEPFGPCPYDYFMVHYSGFITIPANNTIQFMIAADDGGTIQIGNTQFGTWGVKVCQWSAVTTASFPAGSYALDGWFFEWWGDTCFMLAWNINNTGWVIVPDSAFTTTSPATTTTTTTLAPTTTIPETTTTSASTTTSTTTTTTTTTTAPSTTVPVVSEPTTTTPQTTTYTPQPQPTMPEPPTTVPLPQIEPPAIPEIPDLLLPEIETNPPETLELPPEIVDTIPELVDTYPTMPDTIPEPPDTMPLPPDTLPDAPETLDTLPIEVIAELPPELVEALLEAGDTDIPLTEEQFDTVVDTIADLAPEEAVALIEQILATAVTPDQAEELATNPDVLAVITEEQAEEIFETIEVQQLDETQIAELTTAIQNAPLAVQKVFEKTVDIFGGFDDYVPTGSNIPVGERRTLIAIAAGTTLTAASSKIRRK